MKSEVGRIARGFSLKTNCRWPYRITDMCTPLRVKPSEQQPVRWLFRLMIATSEAHRRRSLPQPVPKPFYHRHPLPVSNSTSGQIILHQTTWRRKTGIFQPTDSHWPFNAIREYLSLPIQILSFHCEISLWCFVRRSMPTFNDAH